MPYCEGTATLTAYIGLYMLWATQQLYHSNPQHGSLRLVLHPRIGSGLSETAACGLQLAFSGVDLAACMYNTLVNLVAIEQKH